MCQDFNLDVAIIYLDGTIHFNNWVRPICLPSPKFNDYDGEVLHVTGFGKTFQEETLSDRFAKMLTIEVGAIPCNNRFLNESVTICGIGNGQTPEGQICPGDSGGNS